MLNAEQDIKKWGAVLEHESAPAIQDNYRKAVTAKLLENTEVALRENAAHAAGVLTEDTVSASTGTGALGHFDPILISMVRRSMPNLIAYDIAGVQPMSAPTGLIFAMRANVTDSDGGGNIKDASPTAPELLFNEADTAFSSKGTTPTSDSPFDVGGVGADEYQRAATLATGEGDNFNEAGFSIDRKTVTAKTRQLKAEYSMELAQDLKAVHGLDAESELANILSAEILAEINREVIRNIVHDARIGLSNINESAGATTGIFSLVADADGRWLVEKFKSLIFQLEVEANQIAKDTRRGKGNFVLCSSNVASALAAAGQLDYTPALSANLNVDDTGNTFAGILNGRMKVYVDPYATVDYATVGYKGTNPFDAGMFYCPYVPLTMVRAINETTFQPKMAFKTRYGIVENPFASTLGTAGTTTAGNQYYRKIKVTDINADSL